MTTPAAESSPTTTPTTDRHKTPQAVRLRSLVDAAVLTRSVVGIVTGQPDTSWLRRALAADAEVQVVGAAWLHKGEEELWPGAVLHVQAGRDARTVLAYPLDGERWKVQTQPGRSVVEDQIYLRPYPA